MWKLDVNCELLQFQEAKFDVNLLDMVHFMLKTTLDQEKRCQKATKEWKSDKKILSVKFVMFSKWWGFLTGF